MRLSINLRLCTIVLYIVDPESGADFVYADVKHSRPCLQEEQSGLFYTCTSKVEMILN